MKSKIDSIEDAIDAIGRGEMVIVVDDENRENEGDVIVAGDAISPEIIAFMMRHAKGLICTAMTAGRLESLDIPPMVAENTDSMQTAFAVSVDLVEGTTTGISASDRAKTIQALCNSHSKPADFSRPGHVFPLRACDGGVLVRRGHTEAAIDLAHLAGRHPCGVICEIAKNDGEMARLPDLFSFADEHGLLLITIQDLVEYRLKTEVSCNPSSRDFVGLFDDNVLSIERHRSARESIQVVSNPDVIGLFSEKGNIRCHA